MWFIGLVGIFMFVVGIVVAGMNITLNTAKVSGYYGDSLTDTALVKAGLNIAREALVDDANWGDCQNADKNCSDTDQYGFFPLYSPSLEQTIEDYPIGQKGKLTVKVKFPDSNTALVIIKAQTPKITKYFGAKFQKSAGGLPEIPLVYAPKSTVYGGKACSWFWDGRRLKGITKPNFIVYLDDNFYWSPEIVVPSYSNGDNPKDVIFATNFSTEVSGYKEIDKVYTTGDLYLKNGAYLKVAYANGKVYLDDTSSADEIVENGNFVFPKFRKNLPDNTIKTVSSAGGVYLYCSNQNLTITGIRFFRYIDAFNCNITFKNARVYIGYLYTSNTRIILEDSIVNAHSLYHDNSILTVEGESGINAYSFYAYNSEIHWNSERASFENKYGFMNKITIYPTALFHPKFDYLYFLRNAFNDCTQPNYCLWDTNNLYVDRNSGTVGTFLVRKFGSFLTGSTVIGNVFAEELQARDSTFCNIVDSTGKQIVADEENFYNIIVEQAGGINASASVVYQTVCKDEQDCINQLE